DLVGSKLLLGTKTFNALVTSSTLPNHPTLDPPCLRLCLTLQKNHLQIRIFIKRTAWLAAMSLAENASISSVSDTDYLYQLRQMRTRFHQASTYTCCRSSSEWADDLASQP
ncbi:hypothetical protein DM01DRAFT_1288443, partial [Hesseltinella vesiculosa]